MLMNERRKLFWLILIALVHIASAANFLLLSDLHYDPLYGSQYETKHYCRHKNDFSDDCTEKSAKDGKHWNKEFGAYECDPPKSLIESALDASLALNETLDFILITGDFAAHCLENSQALLETVCSSSQIVYEKFPNATVIPVLGNNDVWPHGWVADGNSSVLNQISQCWGDLGWLNRLQRETFIKGGYYSAKPIPGLVILVLNTLYYTLDWCPADDDDDAKRSEKRSCSKHNCDNCPDDPATQFAWLERQLQSSSASEKFIITSHIGPGRSRGFKDQWRSKYQSRFLEVVNRHSEKIAGLIFAHIHRDSFEIILDDENSANEAIFIASSISPVRKNNPSFRITYLDENFEFVDYTQWYTKLDSVLNKHVVYPVWEKQYTFKEAYAVSSTSAREMLSLKNAMQRNNMLFQYWLSQWPSLQREALEEALEEEDLLFFCAFTALINEEFSLCKNS